MTKKKNEDTDIQTYGEKLDELNKDHDSILDAVKELTKAIRESIEESERWRKAGKM